MRLQPDGAPVGSTSQPQTLMHAYLCSFLPQRSPIIFSLTYFYFSAFLSWTCVLFISFLSFLFRFFGVKCIPVLARWRIKETSHVWGISRPWTTFASWALAGIITACEKFRADAPGHSSAIVCACVRACVCMCALTVKSYIRLGRGYCSGAVSSLTLSAFNHKVLFSA